MSGLETPILLLVFNRPDTTQKVFNIIRTVKPRKLYISSDAPRDNKPQDITLCQATHEIFTQIDWNCELHTNFLDKNHGCDPAVRNGISWFFENEEEGIILEDDCVPSKDFFFFCQSLLEKYRNENQVMLIGGFNQSDHHSKNMSEDYYFSRWGNISGWATWKRTWKQMIYDYADYQITSEKVLKDPYYNKSQEFLESWINRWTWLHYHPEEANWDSQLNYTLQVHDGLCIIPRVNLVQNIGIFGAHSFGQSSMHLLKASSLDINTLTHPKRIEGNQYEDVIRMNEYMDLNKLLHYWWKIHIILRKLHIIPKYSLLTATLRIHIEKIYIMLKSVL